MATKQQKEDFKESKARVLSIFEKILDFTFSNEMHRPGERREGWSNSPNALADIDSEFSLSEFDYRTWKPGLNPCFSGIGISAAIFVNPLIMRKIGSLI